MNFYKTILILAIVLSGLFLYFYKLGKIPSGFYIDEALPGYNAYSILKTGKDEYGKKFPVLFRFYGSYNPPLYTYATVIPVAILGLNIFSVRFVSALAGLLSVIPFYLLLRDSGLFENKLSKLFASVLFIIQPWIIFYSRIGYEVSLAFLIFSFGVYFMWRGLTKKNNIKTGLILLSLSAYAAYAERFLVPLVIIGYLVIFKKRLFKTKAKEEVVKGLIFAFIIQIPLLLLIKTPAFFPKQNMLDSSGIFIQANKIPLPHFLSLTLSFLRELLAQYFTYFSPRSLFFLPDPDVQRSIPELSVLYFWLVIPFFAGLYFLWKYKDKNFIKFLLLLTFLSPLPAALTHDPFATHRALPFFLPLMIIIALGINSVMGKVPSFIYASGFVFLFFISLLFLWRSYFVLLPKERAKVWGYGVEQLAKEISDRPKDSFVIDQNRIKPTYINLALFLKYSPEKYQSNFDQSIAKNYYQNTTFNSNISFANLENRNISWTEDVYKDKILVGDEIAVSVDQASEHFLEKIIEIKSPIDEIIFVGYKTNPRKKCKNDPGNSMCNQY